MVSARVSNKVDDVIHADEGQQLGSKSGCPVEPVAEGKLQVELHRPARTSSHDEGYGLLKYRGPARTLARAEMTKLLRNDQAESYPIEVAH